MTNGITNHTLDHTVSDRQNIAVDKPCLSNDNAFIFVFGIGSGQYGYDTLRMTSDLKCEYTFSTQQKGREVWKRASFITSRNDVKEIDALMREIRFVELEAQYHARIADGTQMFFKLQTSEFRKSVYCNNHFPKPVRRLQERLNALIKKHGTEIYLALPISLKPKDVESEFFEK